jgi:ribosome-binding factor A
MQLGRQGCGGSELQVKRFERSQRVADEIQRIVAAALQREIKDFDLSRVTVTRCDVTRDLSEATVLYSVLGDEEERRECREMLGKVTGFLQRHVGESLALRLTPHLHFRYDDSIARGARMEELFDKIARERDDNDEVGRD